MTTGRPTTRRVTAAGLVTSLLAMSLLAACGGSGSDESLVKPTSTSGAAASADPDGLSPAQREVADAVKAYGDASLARGNGPVKGSAVEDLMTPALVTRLSALPVPAERRDYIGTVTLSTDTVTVDGDTATFTGCQDGSKAYSVKKGETKPGVGSSNIGFTRLDLTLVRQDGRWLVDDPKGEQVSSC